MVEKSATARWNGSLMEGSGTFTANSGVIVDSPISWAARTNEAKGQTSPEELLASAHSACYAMAFSHYLSTNFSAPTSLEVTSSVEFAPKKDGSGMEVTHSHLVVSGSVPDMDAETFAKAAVDAEKGCPVSQALRNNLEITVDATLV